MLKKISFVIVSLIWLSGCAGLKMDRRSPDRPTTNQEPGQAESAPTDEESDFQVTPEKGALKEPPAVGIILGPGMALALSHAGVLKSLEESKLPIKAVVGLEWGSVIGAIYTKQGLANDVQWRVHKLKSEDLPGKSFFTSSLKPEPVATLSPFLKDSLSGHMINKGTIPFACPVHSLQRGKSFWIQSGSAADGVSRCLSFPPFYEPYKQDLVADPFAIDLAARYLRDRGVNLVLLVDVLHNGELLGQAQIKDQYPSLIIWNEIRRNSRVNYDKVDKVIRVPTESMTLLDFSQKQKLIQLGEKAGRQAAKELADKYGL